VAAYLRRQGVLPTEAAVEVESLGGGVSYTVLKASWHDNCLVIKQPLPNLAVTDDWPADVGCVHNEAAAARTYREIINEAGLTESHVPEIRWESDADHVIATECAPPATMMWKEQLLAGEVDVRVARTLGRLLGTVHHRASGQDSVQSAVGRGRPFEQLRLDPYHRTVARRHPDVAPAIEREIARIRDVHRTLVHGDFSPKNVLIEPTGDSQTRHWLLDFEVAHWGDPAFDVAFMLNHLLIKSMYNHELAHEYVEAARDFWGAYRREVNWNVEPDMIRELSVLMLARVDGKSPVEYVSEGPVSEALRAIAKRSLNEDLRTLSAFLAIADGERDLP